MATRIGGLANKPLFFGSSVAEVTSTSLAGNNGGWRGGYAENPHSTAAWQIRGGSTDNPGADVSASGRNTGTPTAGRWGHRTILLGY
ncbi:hypothetical protein FWG76_00235 [Candidatus Saccharibacteria bacterium]|nr:hypothetical protein [Candidatus Saccharibacteria bacterium]